MQGDIQKAWKAIGNTATDYLCGALWPAIPCLLRAQFSKVDLAGCEPGPIGPETN